MLKHNLPDIVVDIPEMKELLEAEQPEIDALSERADSILSEFFIDTADEMLEQWERLCGYQPAPDWPVERRRERVKARLAFGGTATPAVLKEAIEKSGNTQVGIDERYDENIILIKFLNEYGIPRYLDDIKKELELVCPLHIWVAYKYLYAILAHYASFTLEQLGAYTLEQINSGVPLGG